MEPFVVLYHLGMKIKTILKVEKQEQSLSKGTGTRADNVSKRRCAFSSFLHSPQVNASALVIYRPVHELKITNAVDLLSLYLWRPDISSNDALVLLMTGLTEEFRLGSAAYCVQQADTAITADWHIAAR